MPSAEVDVDVNVNVDVDVDVGFDVDVNVNVNVDGIRCADLVSPSRLNSISSLSRAGFAEPALVQAPMRWKLTLE